MNSDATGIKSKLESDTVSKPEDANEALLTMLHSTTQLYMRMVQINLELKKLPTMRLGVFTNSSDLPLM